jgi:hypothetical protein
VLNEFGVAPIVSCRGTHHVVVGCVFLAESDIAVDAERRPGWIGAERDPARLEPIGQGDDQGLDGFLEQTLVLALPRLEPGSVVVLREVDRELDGLRAEPVKVGASTAMAGPPAGCGSVNRRLIGPGIDTGALRSVFSNGYRRQLR